MDSVRRDAKSQFASAGFRSVIALERLGQNRIPRNVLVNNR